MMPHFGTLNNNYIGTHLTVHIINIPVRSMGMYTEIVNYNKEGNKIQVSFSYQPFSKGLEAVPE